ncbi:MAG TPA: hypothetical protein VEU62_07220 [Bryobacterales bacterium]|nr:hypothetical protein [Bryobacterales bacterium]
MDTAKLGHSDRPVDLVSSGPGVYQVEAGTTARDVAAVLFRRQKIILAVFVAILSGTTLGVTWLNRYLFPPRYVAGLKFIVRKDRFDAVVTPADRAVPGLTTSVMPQEIQSEIELLKGADVMQRLAREARVAPVERLERDLTAEPVVAGRNATNLIAVRYSSTDPAEVTRVLEKLPEIYLEKYLRVNRRPEVLEYFRSQAKAYELQLQQAEDDLAEFEKQEPALGEEGRRQQSRQKLAEIEKQRSEAEAAIRDAESRISELGKQLGALPATAPAAARAEESPYLERLKTELLDLENRRAQATFYRDIEQLDRRIREVRRTIAEETQAARSRAQQTAPNPLRVEVGSELRRNQVLLAGLRARRESFVEQEQACREELAAARLIAAENEGQQAELARNVKGAEENFLLYQKKYTEAQEAENLDRIRVLNVTLAEGPQPPARTNRRSTWFYLAFGLVLAAAGSAAAGLTAEMLDHSVHTPRQLESYSALTVLACIPASRTR